MSPADGTTKTRYGHTSMCLAPPTEGQCYLGYQRMQALRNDGTDVSYEVCAPKPLCKGPLAQRLGRTDLVRDVGAVISQRLHPLIA